MMNSTDDGIEYSVFETDWGWMGAAGSSRGLAAVVLPQPTPVMSWQGLAR